MRLPHQPQDELKTQHFLNFTRDKVATYAHSPTHSVTTACSLIYSYEISRLWVAAPIGKGTYPARPLLKN